MRLRALFGEAAQHNREALGTMRNTKGRRRRAVMRRKNQLTLPREVTEALHIHEGDEVEFEIGEDGQVMLRGMTLVPTDQAWFWDEQWQQGEREASEEIAAGRTEEFEDAESMFDALEQER